MSVFQVFELFSLAQFLQAGGKKLVWPWHGQTNTAMVLCISEGYLTTPKIASENDKCMCAFTANYDPTSLQIDRKPHHYTCASSI